ncbi:cytochrome P450 [Ruania alkalisoli]|uniref:Cytochrome P450 n=1 Tax=Ruania alkalisoli TaxID=2779775 RepID=A0A7M1SUZ5_9MICO|nr:cytochrome P450 [Ruania alkalisoli]QOR70774.1 cytochrome P450 [Ruania alkalisoli]
MPLETGSSAEPPDLAAQRSMREAGLLGLDGAEHARLRRAITSRFSVRAVRGIRDVVASTVSDQLQRLLAGGSPGNVTTAYAEPISARMHCHVLGIPNEFADTFSTLFVGGGTTQQKFDFIREVIDAKRTHPGEDVLSDLVRGELSQSEIEGLALVLMASGRDSVAYMITTTTVALLTHPDQRAVLRTDPALMTGAVEEFMRYGAMFLTLFPRTALEDVELDGVRIRAGQSVSVSSVGANRDERKFEEPHRFDVKRDAFGHLGFGHGRHGCVGQQLARVEIAEAISQLFATVPDLRLVEAEQMSPQPFANPVGTYEAGDVIVAWGGV